MCFNRNRDNKIINFYAVIKKDQPGVYLTLTLDRLDAISYATMLIKLAHTEHFKSWCDLRNVSTEDINTWFEYYENCVNDDEKSDYGITKVAFKYSSIAAIMRIFAGNIPLGCSYEIPLEREVMRQQIKLQKEMEKEQPNDK